MKLELLVVPDCPHESGARELALATLAELGMTADLTTTVIATEAEARGRGFVGSPTFLVDGRDLFAQPGASVGVACRVYPTSDGLAGVPSRADLRDALDTRRPPNIPVSDRAQHWDTAFATRPTNEMSWFEASHELSVSLLGQQPGSVVDIGAGAGTLADALLAVGRLDITLLDISHEALAVTRDRLGPTGGQVHYVVTDLLEWSPDRKYDTWHDRAVFHFLTDPLDRESYVETAAQAVAHGGLLVMATFGPGGPTSCSGLPTARHSSDDLAQLFAPAFSMVGSSLRVHLTPTGAEQQFTWAWMRRTTS